MTIRFQNGPEVEGVLLAQTSSTMRVAIAGYEDVVGFKVMNGVWVSDDLDPAEISYQWELLPATGNVTEADCICSPELASRLLEYLFYGTENDVAQQSGDGEAKILAATATC